MKWTLKRFLEIYNLKFNTEKFRYENDNFYIEAGVVKDAELLNELDKLAIKTTSYIKKLQYDYYDFS